MNKWVVVGILLFVILWLGVAWAVGDTIDRYVHCRETKQAMDICMLTGGESN